MGWGVWVARRQGGGAWWTAAVLPALAFLVTLAGVAMTILGLTEAFHGVGAEDAAHRADALAGGITTAMGSTAFSLFTALALTLISFVLCLVGTIKASKDAADAGSRARGDAPPAPRLIYVPVPVLRLVRALLPRS